MQIAVQLYTVREQLAKDYAGTLKRVSDIGYTHAELAGLDGHSAAEVEAMLADTGLTPIAMHCLIEQLEADVNRAIDDVKTLGVDYLVCPYLPEERRKSEADWIATAGLLNTVGDACSKAGIQFCYHHHSFEYEKVGERTGLDLLFDETDPKCVKAELDTYWIRHGGEDPVQRIRGMVQRCPLMHLKDMMDDANRSFGELGAGTLDFDAIFDAARFAGTVWGIVEQDVCPGDPLDSLAKSYAYLKRTGRVTGKSQ